MGDLFDSWWKIAILVILVIVLFGAKKLPGAAKSLGQSMRIFKSEITKLHDDEPVESSASAPVQQAAQIAPVPAAGPAPAAAPSAADQQAQIDALQQQIRDMQRASAMDPVPASKQDDI